jgi:hypothetical protein
MKTPAAALCALALLLPPAASAQEMKLPVFTLYYEGGTGLELLAPEEPEKEQEEADSQRHKLTLRIKEQWSDAFSSNLYSAVSRKDYAGAGDYTWFYLHPDFQWDLGDRARWSAGVRAKWTFYDDSGEGPLSKDLTSLLAGTELALKPVDGLRIEPFLQAVFDLYRNEADSQQTYTAGLRLESRLSADWRLAGRYRGILRFPLGTGDDRLERFNQEFGLNLSWDPNR